MLVDPGAIGGNPWQPASSSHPGSTQPPLDESPEIIRARLATRSSAFGDGVGAVE